jgi:hypothetical protein
MEEEHAASLTNNYGISPDRVSMLGAYDPLQRGLEIPDPFSYDSQVYDRSYELMRDCIVAYLDGTDELD